MGEPLLQAEIGSKKYPQHEVLRDLSLSIRAGEIVSLVGESGCGKSTLLRLIAGLDTDYSGSIRLHGSPLRPHPAAVGVVFQEPRLLPWLTVAANVGFELGRAGAKHPRVDELLAEVGLAGKGRFYPKQLSGGMAQRVAIARALFGQPKVLLLDEPFSAVDAFTRMRLQDLLRRVAEHHGATLLFVTHDIDEAVYLSDRICVMQADPGRIRQEVEIGLPRQRDRGDPRLALLKSRILALLDDGHGDRSKAERGSDEKEVVKLNLLKLAV
ncbi:MAG TPA: ABC transporter ATP-binding protein [Burkholderiaceae bacterium]|jgi:sulfonate transport system ATP-binding protein|nr:ABC transporter ATP-binding protein [Burkholderiaceae bacterium]